MRTLKQIIKQTPIFINSFSSEQEVFDAFNCTDSERSEYKILFASYDTPSYEGYAWGLCVKKETEELFEFGGSHCSCFGLEDQFSPEPVELQVLEHRLANGLFGQNDFKKELLEFLAIPKEVRLG